jgi:CO/xanthine dehydrogenase FAD-binding subunit
MKPPSFHYERPDSLETALEILDSEADRAKVLAGGQSLVALMNLRLASPEIVVDIGRLGGLRYIRNTGSALEIGALTTQASIEHDRAVATVCPLLAEAVPHIGHTAIRNRGTVGGSIAHADPAAELPVVLAALEGEVTAATTNGTRTISADSFFHGFLTTALEPNELVTAVSFPAANGEFGFAFEEFSRRPGDFALASVACRVRGEGDRVLSARVAIGSVGQVPVLAEGVDDLGGATGEDAARAVSEAVARIRTGADIHATAEYRRHLIRRLAERAVRRAVRGGDARADVNR